MSRFLLIILISLFYSSDSFAQQNKKTGFLLLKLNVDSAYAVINNDYFDTRVIANGDSIELTVGNHLINLSVPLSSKYVTRVSIEEHSTFTLSHNFTYENITANSYDGNVAAEKKFGVNLIIHTDDNSEVYLGNQYLGTGFAMLKTSQRKERITIKNPRYGNESFTATIKNERVNSYENFRKPTIANVRTLSVVPGASQLLKRQYLKALGFSIGSAILTVKTVNLFQRYSEERALLNNYISLYNRATNESEALYLGDIAEEQQNKVESIDLKRKLSFLIALSFYGLNIFDAFRSTPQGGYQNDRYSFDFYLSQGYLDMETVHSGVIRYNF